MELIILLLASLLGLAVHLQKQLDFKNLKMNLWDNYAKEHPLQVFTTVLSILLGFFILLKVQSQLPENVKLGIRLGDWDIGIPRFITAVILSFVNSYFNSSIWIRIAKKFNNKKNGGNNESKN